MDTEKRETAFVACTTNPQVLPSCLKRMWFRYETPETMYYTRGTAKRIKINSDIEDSEPMWVSVHGGVMYWHWLTAMKLRHPAFDSYVYHQHQKAIKRWYDDVATMVDNHTFDGDYLRKVHYSVYQPWIEREHKVFERHAEIRKMNWVFDNVLEDPMTVIDKLD